MKQVTVRVTRKHIKEGKRGDALSCPIALALQDAGVSDPLVGSDQFDGYRSKRFVSGCLTRRAQTFIERFDDKKPVKPATFRLKVSR